MFIGICLSTGVVHGSEGCMVPEGAWSGGCMVLGVNGPGGACSRGMPGGDPPATAAGSTHPTGMHSCS